MDAENGVATASRWVCRPASRLRPRVCRPASRLRGGNPASVLFLSHDTKNHLTYHKFNVQYRKEKQNGFVFSNCCYFFAMTNGRNE